MQGTVKPGAWIYLLAVVVFVVGIGILINAWSTAAKEFPDAAGSAFTGALTMGASLERFVVPGSVDVSVDKPGRYVVYYEYRSVVAGTTYSTNVTPPSMDCTVTDTTTGTTVPIRSVVFPETYNYPDHQGEAMLEFDVPAAGIYRVEAAFSSAAGGTPVVLAVGPGIMPEKAAGLVKGTCLGTLVCLLCSVVALTLLIVGLVKRSASRKRAQAAEFPMAMPPPM